MVQKFYDELAYGMEQVLADEGYQKIFAKPKIKTASAQTPASEPVKLSADGITDTFKTIVTLSAMLDEMGYGESAAKLLRVAQDITDEVQIDEADPRPYEAEQELGGSHEGDLDDLLRQLGGEPGSGGAWDVDQDLPKELPDLGDANDAMDKPSDEDEEEGNPEC
jgi:hypothetical protein